MVFYPTISSNFIWKTDLSGANNDLKQRLGAANDRIRTLESQITAKDSEIASLNSTVQKLRELQGPDLNAQQIPVDASFRLSVWEDVATTQWNAVVGKYNDLARLPVSSL